MEKMSRKGLGEVEDDGGGIGRRDTWEINLKRENYGMNMDRAN